MQQVTPEQIAAALAALRRGELVAFPTETVYGLGADASNEAAVRRIFAAKGRPADHPVIVHLPHAGLLEQWAGHVPEAAWRLAERFWPGPLTMILPRAAHVLDVVTGGQSTVGLRVPDHPVAQALLHAFGGGIAAPSANRFGRVSPTRAEHVRAELGDAVAVILDGGPCRVGLESTIVDLSGPQPAILRPGHISARQIEEVLGVPVSMPAHSRTRAPGTLPGHYAPVTAVELVADADLEARARAWLDQGRRVAVMARRPPPADLQHVPWRALPDDPVAYGHALYATLRELDSLRVERILVARVPEGEAWTAVRDRLTRAAHGAAQGV
ncbi:L-threonylcarbamoyladenylate synthase [Kallotenue papyrolyticum]|uniref:L-threonylcarbamoyladenylate synthase n=1 Tax=Kallotenue papyrolyticum TaxID=1325125 RepID=UPI0005B9F684|nr:L-threonylcarbamoyladenylate synthase [Kallotenue papyrolyticum]